MEQTHIDVNIMIWNSNNTRFGLNESAIINDMSYEQLGNIMRAFHVIAEAIKEGRNLEVNGQVIHNNA